MEEAVGCVGKDSALVIGTILTEHFLKGECVVVLVLLFMGKMDF